MEKYDLKTIGLITTFEKLTHTHVKKVFTDVKGQLTVIVEEGQAGKAIGKAGMHVRKLQHWFKKKIRIVEFHHDPREFIKNYISPLTVDSMTCRENTITLSSKDTRTKGILIGRERKNLKELNMLVRKFFKNDVTVI